MVYQSFLIKYAEIGTKGKNRYLFEDALSHQIKNALKKTEGSFVIAKESGRIYVQAAGEYDYDEVTELNKYGYAGVKQDGLWGVINAKGEIVIKPTYNLDKNEVIDFIGKSHKGIGAEYYTDI